MTLTAKWGIWCLSTKGWVYNLVDSMPIDVVHATRREATIDWIDFTTKYTRKDYEVRKYKETP